MKTCYEYKTDINAILSNNYIRLWIPPQIINKTYINHTSLMVLLSRSRMCAGGRVSKEHERNHLFTQMYKEPDLVQLNIYCTIWDNWRKEGEFR